LDDFPAGARIILDFGAIFNVLEGKFGDTIRNSEISFMSPNFGQIDRGGGR